MKRLSVLAALLLAACLLASCSGKEETAAAEETGGGNYYNENFSKKIALTWYGGGAAPLEDNSWGELKMEELFNLDLTVVRADAEGITAMFASGNIPDFITETTGGIAAMDAMGVIGEIPVEKIREFMPVQYENGIALDPNAFTYSMIKGRNMAIPRFNYANITFAPAIRADWLKKTGKPIPKTLQDWEDVMVAFRNNDPDGNGRKDTYGMTSFTNTGTHHYFANTFGAFGVNPFLWRETADGGVEFGFTTDDFVKGLKTLNRWYQMELIDPEFITQELRTSGEDIAFKFSNGRIGILESYHMDDFQLDNDGHISAKWVAAHDEWKKFFADNAGNEEVMYQYDTPTDFVDYLPEPYYIVMNPPIGPEGKQGAYRGNVIAARHCVGIQVEKDPDKLERILRIIEVQVADPDVKINHLGPEEHGQWMTTSDGTRVFNPNMRDNPMYHAQGVLGGWGWYFWPMWQNDKLAVELIGGPKNNQRYVRLLPLFKSFPFISNAVQGVLPSQSEHFDLLGEYVAGYITQAVRGDLDIDATYPQMKADWFSRGGTQLTQEANEWFRASRQ